MSLISFPLGCSRVAAQVFLKAFLEFIFVGGSVVNTFFHELKPYFKGVRILLSNDVKHIVRQFISTLYTKVYLESLEVRQVFRLCNGKWNKSLYWICLSKSD